LFFTVAKNTCPSVLKRSFYFETDVTAGACLWSVMPKKKKGFLWKFSHETTMVARVVLNVKNDTLRRGGGAGDVFSWSSCASFSAANLSVFCFPDHVFFIGFLKRDVQQR
jgi:hypothetical protein